MTLIFCRISSDNQSKGLSLANQEEKLISITKKLNWKVGNITKYVKSVYKNNIFTDEEIRSYKRKKMLFYSVDRFSRNITNGTSITKKLLSKKNTLFFAKEKIRLEKSAGMSWNKFIHNLKLAQEESDKISQRVSDSKKYAKQHGLYAGGRIPYGMIKVKHGNLTYLEQDMDKKNVIEFITLCRTYGTTAKQLNTLLKKCNTIAITYPIEIDNGNITNEYIEDDGLYYEHIANLLNDYQLDTDIVWNGSKVKNVYLYHKNRNDSNNLDDMSYRDVEVFDEDEDFNNLDNTEDNVEDNVKDNAEDKVRTNKKVYGKVRRSKRVRINVDLAIQFSELNM
jgi:hypothetical protein